MSTPEAVQPGPCVPWITAEDVASGCDVLDSSDDPSVYDNAAQEASYVLWLLSGKKYRGECGPITVRPCQPSCVCAPDPCGCCFLSEVRLYDPVREIVEVKIDGDVIDPSEYRVDRHRWLIRLADTDGNRQRWPACQRLDLDDTEDRTFSVTYTFGQDPPLLGQDAAVQLACQIAAFGPDSDGECALPDGTVTVTRQGVTIDLERFVEVGIAALPLVGMFLDAENPYGLRRAPSVWSPDIPRFARKVG